MPAPPGNTAPSATFVFAPATRVVGEAVSFTEQVSDPEGDAVTLSRDLGDGATATGTSPTHAYLIAGSYTVALTATDEHGTATTTFETLTPRASGSAPARRLLGSTAASYRSRTTRPLHVT